MLPPVYQVTLIYDSFKQLDEDAIIVPHVPESKTRLCDVTL